MSDEALSAASQPRMVVYDSDLSCNPIACEGCGRDVVRFGMGTAVQEIRDVEDEVQAWVYRCPKCHLEIHVLND